MNWSGTMVGLPVLTVATPIWTEGDGEGLVCGRKVVIIPPEW
jgi:hypothetical protein